MIVFASWVLFYNTTCTFSLLTPIYWADTLNLYLQTLNHFKRLQKKLRQKNQKPKKLKKTIINNWYQWNHTNIMTISWRYHDDIMTISWRYHFLKTSILFLQPLKQFKNNTIILLEQNDKILKLTISETRKSWEHLHFPKP